jgi:hypothetical protein
MAVCAIGSVGWVKYKAKRDTTAELSEVIRS